MTSVTQTQADAPLSPGDRTDANMALARLNARRFGFAAGVIAALVMLLALVLLRLVSGVISLLEVVADGFLLLLPGALFSTILDTLQRSAKPLMYLGVAVATIVVGGVLGRWYSSQPGWKQAARIVTAVWLVFGLGVYLLAGAGPFGARLQAGPVWHGGTLLVLFAVFGLALVEAFAFLSRRARGEPAPADPGRRLMLRRGAVALLAVLGAGALWRLLGRAAEMGAGSRPSEAGALAGSLSNAPPFDIPGLSAELTPTNDFYQVSKNFIDPSVQASGWKLKIDGLVDRPMELSYDQLRALPASEGIYALMCISNEVGGEYWSNARWKGVKLSYLLEQAGAHTDAYKAVFSGADDYKDSVKLASALHPEALLAWEMNGEPLRKEHGFPARLLIPDIYGMKNVKWLTGISIVKEDVKGFWQYQGWDDDAPYQIASRIDTPRPRASVQAGLLDVAGVAFAGDRGIQTVEVSTDGGKTWQEAEVKPRLSPEGWQLWRTQVTVDRSVRDVRVRATDGRGRQQIREPAPPFPTGSTGYHTVNIAVT
jgi:DMSO/TMAO reductase YedYZ molybdopterin-dependent catalytic subunit